MLSALIHYCVATQQCLVRQLVHQWQRPTVPLVLNGSYSQAILHSQQIVTKLARTVLNPTNEPL